MRTIEETVKDAQKWHGYAPGSLERDALYYLERYNHFMKKIQEYTEGKLHDVEELQEILDDLDNRYIVKWNDFVKKSFVTRDDAQKYIDDLVNNLGYMRESLTIEEVRNDRK